MNRQELMDKIKKIIAKDYPASKIILFGSRCRGDDNVFSDWDILVIVNKNLEENEKIEIHNRFYEIELKTGEILNSIIHTTREWNSPLMQSTPFFKNVQKEGICI